jgi:2-oxoglutarate dehydrogenase E1 component
VGIEYTHIPDREQCDWIRSRVEIPTKFAYSKEQKWVILDRLLWADSFERFVQSKYPGEKRFGLDGCEVLIPGMKAIVSVIISYLSIFLTCCRLTNWSIRALKIS